ncbi:MAG: DUF4215 domain-containing protein [Deltaproteobacteria bacterium]|jgi:cysteine-rich repeat protein|nr:DUF4215 domain-containing protein [Deltaproteobacteria bacterium]MBW2537123.1 DUF4215 domain-containing protein [Deltaproteobacteria bacterium]
MNKLTAIALIAVTATFAAGCAVDTDDGSDVAMATEAVGEELIEFPSDQEHAGQGQEASYDYCWARFAEDHSFEDQLYEVNRAAVASKCIIDYDGLRFGDPWQDVEPMSNDGVDFPDSPALAQDEVAMVYENCGDGVINVGEQCDDGNTDSSDGCSATCKVEAGFVCLDEPSTCLDLLLEQPLAR